MRLGDVLKHAGRGAKFVLNGDDDDVLLVRAESSADEDDGSSPYVRFCGIGENRLRCEVSSHTSLAGDHLLDQVGVEALNGLVLIGWSASFTYLTMEDLWGTRPRTN